MDTPYVIVGIDCPAGTAAAAIKLAATEAVHRHAALRVVAACAPAEIADTERFVAALARCVGGVYAGVTVEGSVHPGSAERVLVAASAGAALVVVAGDARVHHAGVPGGRVAAYVAAHAEAPVVVVPPAAGERARDRRVVVGVNASAAAGHHDRDGAWNADAIGFAFDEAAARGATLHAVTVWDLPARHGVRAFGPLPDPSPLPEVAAAQAAALAPWREKFPDVPVRRDVVRAPSPLQALCQAAADAELLVVGSRGALLGAVASGLVRYTPTPLAVVRPTPDGTT